MDNNGRITCRMDDGTAYVQSETGTEGVGFLTTQRRTPEMISRLAAYEDTGLSPDEIVAIKAKLVKFSEAFKGAQAVCEVAINEKKQAIAERDRFKARAEAAEKDITALARRAIDGFQDSKFITPCRWCAEREQCDLLTNGANTCFKWRGPQEGAADVECSAKPEASKENTRDFYGIIMDNVVDHIQQCYTKETVTLSDGTRAVIRRWKPFPDMTKEGENG